MKIYVDIDKTICQSGINNDYSTATPIPDNIAKVNKLYEEGHEIIMWTARGTRTGLQWFHMTYQQLQDWKVTFHELRMGKPDYDLLIDDKALNSLYHWNSDNIQTLLQG